MSKNTFGRDAKDILRCQRPLWRTLSGGAPLGVEAAVPGFLASVQALYDQGYSMTDVGLMFGLSRERIRQLTRRNNLRPWQTSSPARIWSWETGAFIPSAARRSDVEDDMRRIRAIEKHTARINGWQEHFWSKVALAGENDCWLWTGTVTHPGPKASYGSVALPRAIALPRRGGWFAHRLAFLYSYGYLTDGLQVCHTCDNGICCNPTHLFEGTAKENIQDAIRKGRHIASPQRYEEMMLVSKLRGMRQRRLNRKKARA